MLIRILKLGSAALVHTCAYEAMRMPDALSMYFLSYSAYLPSHMGNPLRQARVLSVAIKMVGNVVKVVS